MDIYDKHHRRYIDDLDRERILYYNGQYYRIKEAYFSGGPYAMPHGLWDPFGPWRMARPIPHNLEYWTDLDYRYQNTVCNTLKKVGTHFHIGEAEINKDLLCVPLGTKINIKNIYSVTILFGDTNLNYTIDIDPDKVYHIDYMENAVLQSVIGRVVDCDLYKAKDYRGEDAPYTMLKLDCSRDFEHDIRNIDSRDIRYINCLSDIQKSSSITKTFIGVREPDDPYGEFGAWYNPSESKYYLKTEEGWKDITSKPEEDPGEDKYWHWNSNKFEWEVKEIPACEDDNGREYVWIFNESTERWERQLHVPKPLVSPLPKPSNIYSDSWMYSKPNDVAEYGQEWYFNTILMEWDKRDSKPKEDPGEDKEWYFNEGTDSWITIPARGDRQVFNGTLDDLANNTYKTWVYSSMGDQIGWFEEEVEPPLDTETFDEELYTWIYNPKTNDWYVTPKVYTYNPDKNEWTLEKPAFYEEVTTTREGYKAIYNYYYNLWFEYPIQDNINEIIKSKIDEKDMIYDVYTAEVNRTGKLVDHRVVLYFMNRWYNHNDRHILVGNRHNWDKIAYWNTYTG